MKKIPMIIIIITLLLLVGCSSGNSQNEFTNKLLEIDKNVVAYIDQKDSFMNSQDHKDSKEIIKKLNEIKQGLEKQRDLVNKLDAPNEMQTIKKDYQTYLGEYILGLEETSQSFEFLIKATEQNNITYANNSTNLLFSGSTKTGKARRGLEQVRTELTN